VGNNRGWVGGYLIMLFLFSRNETEAKISLLLVLNLLEGMVVGE